MICPYCRAFNDDSNVFCVSCGESFVSPGGPGPTMLPQSFIPGDSDPSPSQPTVLHAENPMSGRLQPPPAFDNSYAQFQQSFPAIPPSNAQQPQKSRAGLLAAVGVLAFLVVVAGAVGVYLLLNYESKSSEKFPTSLGLFFQNAEKTKVTEITRRDQKDAGEARDAIKSDSGLAKLDPRPTLILYADAKDVPVSDLKLVEIDSIKDDGTVRQIDFKAATVEGKQDMKRLWLTEDLAPGKYAFAVFDGYFEDGKHHFWPFEVSGGSRKNNDSIAKELTISRKAAASPTPKAEKSATPRPTVEPPPNSSAARVQSSNVILRSGPSQSSSKIGMLSAGQKVYIIEYSDRYEVFVTRDGRALNSNYAYIQTESGKRGWVFAAFIK